MAAEDQKDETPESQSESDVPAAIAASEPVEMERKGLLGRKIGMTQGGLHPAPSIYCLQRGEERLSSLESPSVGQLRAS